MGKLSQNHGCEGPHHEKSEYRNQKSEYRTPNSELRTANTKTRDRSSPSFHPSILPFFPFMSCTRILEMQNSLQMSQVFFGITHLSFAPLLFKDSICGTTELARQRYRLSSRPVNARANQEPTRYAENAQAMTQSFNKFWSRCSEAASTRQRCSQCHHDTLRSRRSEARPR